MGTSEWRCFRDFNEGVIYKWDYKWVFHIEVSLMVKRLVKSRVSKKLFFLKY